MTWKKRVHDTVKAKTRNKQGLYKFCSVLMKLRDEGKINQDFEIMFNRLTMEELIALKLELASRVADKPMYGYPLWNSMPSIARDAVMKYIISVSNGRYEAIQLLGVKPQQFFKMRKWFSTWRYFNGKSDGEKQWIYRKVEASTNEGNPMDGG
jgi:hypothetical protein